MGRLGSALAFRPRPVLPAGPTQSFGLCVYFPVGFPPGLVKPLRAETCFGLMPDSVLWYPNRELTLEMEH